MKTTKFLFLWMNSEWISGNTTNFSKAKAKNIHLNSAAVIISKDF
jgi:hypothetical protein